ncbi:MAG: DUF885 family protein [Lachnospiraceae bacterium]|nr:DUF885 family protein [Lachnospiraceae bacterium]
MIRADREAVRIGSEDEENRYKAPKRGLSAAAHQAACRCVPRLNGNTDKMKKIKKKIAVFLTAVLCVIALGACKSSVKNPGSKRERNEATPTVTAVPTAVPTDNPTPEPTPDVKPWATPNFGKITDYTDEQKKFNKLLDDLLVELLDGAGISMHFYFEEPEKYGLSKQLNFGEADESSDGYEQYAEMCRTYQARLAEIRYDELTPGQKLNYDRLKHEFEAGQKYAQLNTSAYCGYFSLNNNIISGLSTNLSEYTFLKEQDILDYFTTLEDLPSYLNKVLDGAKKAYIDDGCLMTEEMIDNLLEKVDELLVTENNPLIESFAQNIRETGISKEGQDAYVARYQDVLNTIVFPALKDFAAEAEKMRPYADKELFGMCKLEGGKEYYEFLAQETLGVSMNGYQMLEYMQKRFDKEYNELVDFANDISNIRAFAKYPYKDYKVTDAKEMIDSLKEYIKTDYPAIPDTDYIVSSLPKAMQQPNVLAYFLPPQYDVQQRKVIRYNPSSLTEDGGASFFNTLAHEGYPGHLYQNEYFANCEGYHPINCILNYLGYMEGWAVAAGDNAYSYIIDDEKVAYLATIDYNINMEILAIASIGINYAGWEAADVEQFFAQYDIELQMDLVMQEVTSEGVIFLPYSFGRCLILDTMEKLEAKGYTEMEARTAILNIGPCTFDVLWKNLGIE